MRHTPRHLTALLALSLLLSACTAAAEEAQQPADATPRPIEATATARATSAAAGTTASVATASVATASVATASVATASVATAQPALPEADATQAPLPDAADLTQTAGRNADGTYYLGSPDAPVTVFDYGDFL